MNKSNDANSNSKSKSNIRRILIPSELFSFGSLHDHVHHDDMNIHNETETETKKVGSISSILEEALALLLEFDEHEDEMPVGSSASNSNSDSHSKNSSSSLFDIVSSTRK